MPLPFSVKCAIIVATDDKDGELDVLERARVNGLPC